MAKPSLILMPGLDGTGELFAPLLAVLPPGTSARVLTYPKDEALSYNELLARVDEQLAGEDEIVLIAESFSGPLALRHASAHPSRVRGLVLCASFVCSPAPRWLRCLATPPSFRLPMPEVALRRLLLGHAAPSELVRQVRHAVRSVRPDVLASRLQAVFDVDCTHALRTCSAPILYIVAGNDALLGHRGINPIRSIRPDVTVQNVRGPHLLLQAEPQAAWREIERYLRGIGAMA